MSIQVQDVLVSSLVCRPQVRTASGLDDESIAALADSIRESGGIHTPLLVRREGTEQVVLDGERRLRAARMIGMDRVPAIVIEGPLSENEVIHRQLVLDAQRIGLTPLERAKAIARLMTGAGWTAEQTAKKLGLSAATVSRSLALLKLPESIQAKVSSGEISADTAYHLGRAQNATVQEELATAMAGGLLSRDAVARKIKRTRRAREREAAGLARVTAVLDADRTITVAGKGLTLEALVEWLEALLAKARKAKSQGLTLHTFIRTLKDQASA